MPNLRLTFVNQAIIKFGVGNIYRLSRYDLKTTTLFQYMIGNKDWGLTFSKNVKYLDRKDKVIVVPYDFDFSALVGASYTTPKKGASQAFVHGRVYQGFEEELISMQPVIDKFVAKRNNLNDVILNCKWLRSGAKKEMIAYLDFFFDNTDSLEFTANSL